MVLKTAVWTMVALAMAWSSITVKAEGAKVGEPAPDWTLNSVTDGESYTLSELPGIVVMIWQSNQCPWDRMRPEGGYQRVLSPLAKEYQEKGVTFIAINSNKNESVEDLASYHKEHELPYPILKDPGNKVADAYGAKTTPHIFIRDAQGKLIYKGGIEKAPTSPEKCGQMDEQYLRPVLDAAIAGETLPYTETVSKGCSIKRQ